MARASTSQTPAREIIQGNVDSSSLLAQDIPPTQRAPTAVIETPEEYGSATVSISKPAPITAARIATLLYNNS